MNHKFFGPFAVIGAAALIAVGCSKSTDTSSNTTPTSRSTTAAAPTPPTPVTVPDPNADQNPPPPLAVGTAAPPFESKNLAGKTVSLSSLRGKVVLVDFWATWCGPCKMAIPTLEAISEKYHSKGLEVVGISVDDQTTVSHVKPMVKQFGITYDILATPKDNQAVQVSYNAGGIPSQYLIDKKGIVRWSQGGYSEDEGVVLSALIEKLQSEPS